MKPAIFSLVLLAGGILIARADLTVVQALETPGSPATQITILTKGDKMRIDSNPQVSTIVDARTGDLITLMRDQKCAVRISANKMKAAAAMISKFSDNASGAEQAKPKPTGRKEIIRGYPAEEYVVSRGNLKASYWLAPTYPNGAAILRQLQAVSPEAWSSAHPNEAGFRDFPALPIRAVVDTGRTKITTELLSVKQESIPDTAFAIPADYREVKGPEVDLPGPSAPAPSPR
jgi:uncharacterized protein DUF4412